MHCVRLIVTCAVLGVLASSTAHAASFGSWVRGREAHQLRLKSFILILV
jgi:hypothetical protein